MEAVREEVGQDKTVTGGKEERHEDYRNCYSSHSLADPP